MTAYVGLGSNLGDRVAALDGAVAALRATPGVTAVRRSSLYETAPVGGPAGQGRYLNAAAELETTLSPEDLLARLLAIETDLGRVRTVPDGPRTIDLDLLVDDQVRDDPQYGCRTRGC
ncbi:MAG: 2-amino-4-hydroxy-6-hydroxymethyldihydropteridine diphosphokinase [Gemmataceae bacterium]